MKKRRVLLEQVINKFSIGVCISNRQNGLFRESLFINHAYAGLVRLDKKEIIKNLEIGFQLIHPDDIETVKNYIANERYSGSISFMILKCVEKEVIWIRYTIHKIDNFLVNIAEDINEENEQEEISELLKIYTTNIVKESIAIVDLNTN